MAADFHEIASIACVMVKLHKKATEEAVVATPANIPKPSLVDSLLVPLNRASNANNKQTTRFRMQIPSFSESLGTS